MATIIQHTVFRKGIDAGAQAWEDSHINSGNIGKTHQLGLYYRPDEDDSDEREVIGALCVTEKNKTKWYGGEKNVELFFKDISSGDLAKFYGLDADSMRIVLLMSLWAWRDEMSELSDEGILIDNTGDDFGGEINIEDQIDDLKAASDAIVVAFGSVQVDTEDTVSIESDKQPPDTDLEYNEKEEFARLYYPA